MSTSHRYLDSGATIQAARQWLLSSLFVSKDTTKLGLMLQAMSVI